MRSIYRELQLSKIDICQILSMWFSLNLNFCRHILLVNFQIMYMFY